MAAFKSNSLQLIIFQLAMLWISGSADTNYFRGSVCGYTAINRSSPWAANFNSVFTSLAGNVNLSNGYYKTEAGTGSDKAYGQIQCRGDLSTSDCGACTRESFTLAAQNCGGSKSGVIWQKWCLLRYSNASFYGDWEGSSAAIQPTNATGLTDTTAADAGMNMMYKLAEDTPNERLMFARTATEDQRGWKWYGLAQCTGDMGKSECGDCLDHNLKSFESYVRNKTAWEIYGMGCFMMYDDHPFYFNSSTTTSAAVNNLPKTRAPARGSGVGAPKDTNAGNRASGGWFMVGIVILTTAMAYL